VCKVSLKSEFSGSRCSLVNLVMSLVTLAYAYRRAIYKNYHDLLLLQVLMTAIRGTDEMGEYEAYVPNSDRKYLIITLTIVLMAYLISMLTDCLGIVLELNGILAAVPLAYVLPGLCYLKLEEGPVLSSKKLPALGLLTAGILAAISGLLLIIFNSSSGTCFHGKIMPYCVENSTLHLGATTVSTDNFVLTSTEREVYTGNESPILLNGIKFG